MGNQCCGPSKREIDQMNKEGRYTRAQIDKAVNDEWMANNPGDMPTVNKKVGEKIVKGSVTSLMTFGGVAKFTPATYNKLFNSFKTPDGNLDIDGATGLVNKILDEALP